MANSRSLAAGLCLFFLLVMAMTSFSFFPYQEVNWVGFTQSTSGGTVKRQAIYSALLIVAMAISLSTFSHTFRNTFHLKAIGLVTFWAILSVSWSSTPDIAARRLILYVFVLITVISLTSNLRSVTFVKVMLFTMALILLINYYGVFFLRDHAVTESSGEFSWRGSHAHKNAAGHISAITAIIWFWGSFMFRPRIFYLTVSALAAIFTYNSQSKSAWGALFIVIIVSYFLSKCCHQSSSRTKIVLALIFSLGTLVVILSFLSANALVQSTTGDATLTGRTELWQLVLNHIYESPLVGVGFESFWLVGEEPSPLTGSGGWVDRVFQAHNGYLDVVLTLGVIGLATLLLFVIAPILDSKWLKDGPFPIIAIYYTLWVYGIFVNVVESSLLKKDNYIWTCMLIGVFGLRQLVVEVRRPTLNRTISGRSGRL